MKKVLILAEGQMEETFLKRMLGPYLVQFDVAIVPTILATKRTKSGPDFKGGATSYTKARKEIRKLLGDSSAALVTTMLDYYGLPDDFPGRRSPAGQTPIEKVQSVEAAMNADIGDVRFRAYLSLHEFEAILFVSPGAIAQSFASPDLEPRLAAIRTAFSTPEDIDDDPAAAPSARLKALYPRYSKPFFGVLIASRIGLAEVREECKHFNEWLTALENVGVAPDV